MTIKAADVKKLRDKTGAGMMECKKALTEADGDFEKAIDVLRKRGLEVAKKKSARAAKDGLIHSYIHGNGKVGVLIEVNCETDFVARTDDFQSLVKDLCMQVAASAPIYVSRESVPKDLVEKEKTIYMEMALQEGKPEKIVDKIATGKLEKFYAEICLEDQPFIKDDKHKKKVKQVVDEVIGKLGENIKVRRFVRFQLGEEA